jgi:hypothetical protein
MNPALLLALQTIIERSYGMPRIIENAGAFLIGDHGFRLHYRAHPPGPLQEQHTGARLLVRADPILLRVSLYYPDALVRHLERNDPRAGIGDDNIDAFATLVEELDHLLTLASRASEGRPVSLLELEHHAAVTKYLLVVHFLGRLTGRRRVPAFYRTWARHHILEKYAVGCGEEGERYQEAARMAGRYLSYFERLPQPARGAELRAFHSRTFGEQVSLLARAA